MWWRPKIDKYQLWLIAQGLKRGPDLFFNLRDSTTLQRQLQCRVTVSLHVHILGHRGKTWSLNCHRKAVLLVSELAQSLELGPGLFSNLWDSTTEQRLKGAACNFQLYCELLSSSARLEIFYASSLKIL